MDAFVLGLDGVALRYARQADHPIDRVRVSRWLRLRGLLGRLEEVRRDRLAGMLPTFPSGLWINTFRHHLTYARLHQLDGPLTYVHVDAHHDTGRFREENAEMVSNSAFVDAIAELPQVEEVVMLGCYHDRYRCRDQRELIESESLPEIEGEIYLSLDADVLSQELFPTRYCQGFLGMEDIGRILDHYREQLMAADLMGLDFHQPEQNYAVYERLRQMF